jgi:hypothetical protein
VFKCGVICRSLVCDVGTGDIQDSAPVALEYNCNAHSLGNRLNKCPPPRNFAPVVCRACCVSRPLPPFSPNFSRPSSSCHILYSYLTQIRVRIAACRLTLRCPNFLASLSPIDIADASASRNRRALLRRCEPRH